MSGRHCKVSDCCRVASSSSSRDSSRGCFADASSRLFLPSRPFAVAAAVYRGEELQHHHLLIRRNSSADASTACPSDDGDRSIENCRRQAITRALKEALRIPDNNNNNKCHRRPRGSSLVETQQAATTTTSAVTHSLTQALKKALNITSSTSSSLSTSAGSLSTALLPSTDYSDDTATTTTCAGESLQENEEEQEEQYEEDEALENRSGADDNHGGEYDYGCGINDGDETAVEGKYHHDCHGGSFAGGERDAVISQEAAAATAALPQRPLHPRHSSNCLAPPPQPAALQQHHNNNNNNKRPWLQQQHLLRCEQLISTRFYYAAPLFMRSPPSTCLPLPEMLDWHA